MRAKSAAALLTLVLLLGGCTVEPERARVRHRVAEPEPVEPLQEAALPPGVHEPPVWLGRRELPRGEYGFGTARRTPRLLRDRRLATRDVLPPPDSERFEWTIGPATPEVLRRSTWSSRCPVPSDELAYVTLSFWGFDRRYHTGELLIRRDEARSIVKVFRRLHRARWPIEEMSITTKAELAAPPTGDGNNTSAFVCRESAAGGRWSEHALGLAVDVNPFHNPYVRDDLVLPERALAYVDRDRRRPGMISPGDVVTRAFASIGWRWGGDWATAKDWMHFSATGE